MASSQQEPTAADRKVQSARDFVSYSSEQRKKDDDRFYVASFDVPVEGGPYEVTLWYNNATADQSLEEGNFLPKVFESCFDSRLPGGPGSFRLLWNAQTRQSLNRLATSAIATAAERMTSLETLSREIDPPTEDPQVPQIIVDYMRQVEEAIVTATGQDGSFRPARVEQHVEMPSRIWCSATGSGGHGPDGRAKGPYLSYTWRFDEEAPRSTWAPGTVPRVQGSGGSSVGYPAPK